MLPIFSYKSNPSSEVNNRKILLFNFKKLIKYIIFYCYPRLLGKLLSPILKYLNIKKYKFIRSDCDHFGSWIFLLIYLNKEKIATSLIFV